jgi:hypothetical protein
MAPEGTYDMASTAGETVISEPKGRAMVLGLAGAATFFATLFVVAYLIWPERMGPSPRRPNADSLADVALFAAFAWSVTGLLWLVIDREVAVVADRLIVIRGTGRRTTVFRDDVKSVHSYPVQTWFLTWVSFRRGAMIGRSIFFSRFSSLPAADADGKDGRTV